MRDWVRPFLLGFILVALLGVIAFTTAPRVYDAEAILVVEPPHQHPSGWPGPDGAASLMVTEIAILTSPAQISRVIDALDLRNHPEFQGPQLRPDWRARLLGVITPALEPRLEDAEARLGRLVADRYTVKQVNPAYVVEVGAWARSPELARNLSITAAQEYIDSRLDDQLTSMRQAIEWLSDRLDMLREELNAKEEALEEYRATVFRDGRCLEAWDGDCEDVPLEELEELRRLERDAEVTRTLYETILERAQQLDDMAPTWESDARIISLPDIPLATSRPNRLHYVMIATVLGLLAGFVSALLHRALKKTSRRDLIHPRNSALQSNSSRPCAP